MSEACLENLRNECIICTLICVLSKKGYFLYCVSNCMHFSCLYAGAPAFWKVQIFVYAAGTPACRHKIVHAIRCEIAKNTILLWIAGWTSSKSACISYCPNSHVIRAYRTTCMTCDWCECLRVALRVASIMRMHARVSRASTNTHRRHSFSRLRIVHAVRAGSSGGSYVTVCSCCCCFCCLVGAGDRVDDTAESDNFSAEAGADAKWL